MSETLFEGGNPRLAVSRFTGPADGNDRRRWQFDPVGADGVAVLRWAELCRLYDVLGLELNKDAVS